MDAQQYFHRVSIHLLESKLLVHLICRTGRQHCCEFFKVPILG